MKWEIDLMLNYSRSKRNVEGRDATKNPADRALARKFGKEFFDGDRSHGYGVFAYHSWFWRTVISTFQQHCNLTAKTVLYVDEWNILFDKADYTGDYYWFML